MIGWKTFLTLEVFGIILALIAWSAMTSFIFLSFPLIRLSCGCFSVMGSANGAADIVFPM